VSQHLYTRGEFANEFLKKIGAPVSKNNRRAMLAWMQAEGDAGRFNPLNTTQEWPGATDFNWVHVKNYASFMDGVNATVRTLNYGADHGLYGYKPIRARLRGDKPAWRTLKAVENSQWGTGGLALRVLRTVPVLSVEYAHHRLAQ
jgi:hypothetical protein